MKWWIIAIIMFIAGVFTLGAQPIVNYTSLHIESDVELFVPDQLINRGILQNEGLMRLGGNWINESTYHGNGELALFGSQVKQFDNNDQVVNMLTIHVGGTVNIVDNLTISGSLNLYEGLVLLEDGKKILLEENASIVGGDVDSYIIGQLHQSGNGYRHYPIGTLLGYAPVEVWQSSGTNTPLGVAVTDNPLFDDSEIDFSYESVDTHIWAVFSDSSASGSFEINLPQVTAPGRVITKSTESWILQEPLEAGAVAAKLSLTDQQVRAILINPVRDGKLYVSTTLMPSASNEVNKCIFVYGGGLKEDEFSFRIFNRWGLSVFESASAEEMRNKGWNGVDKKSGKSVEPGAYPYQLRAINAVGETVKISGIINVVR